MSTALRPNAIHALDTLPPDLVRQLAYAAQGLAATHVGPVKKWPWQTMGRGLDRCDKCERTWVHGCTAQHALWCPVGRTQEMAAKVLSFALPQRRRDDGPKSMAQFLDEREVRKLGEAWERGIAQPLDPDRVKVLEPGLRITEIPHERSGGSAEPGRPGGDPAALPYRLDHHVAPDAYQEPLAWDPKLGVVVDRHGHTVANMLLTDLSVLEQENFGERIAVCVNFCREMPNDELRKLDAIMSAAVDEAREEKIAAVIARIN